MARIACLWVPGLPLAAVLRLEPDLCGIPVGVTVDRTPQARMVAMSPEACAHGLRPGMTTAVARATCAALVVRPCSVGTLIAAGNTLADVGGTLSSRVELREDGTVFLDCAGSSALCASEAELATMLAARAERQRLRACVGVGGSKLTAYIAARESGGVRIIPPGEERAYLAPLSITLLDPDASLAAMLASWGIRRIGDLAALPAGEVAHRLGSAGARLARQARGEDDAPLECRPMPVSFTESIELDHGIERLEPLVFLLHRLIDRLTSRLALHGLSCGALDVQLMLEGDGLDVRRLAPAAPTGEAKALLTLVRSHLEGQLPTRAVVGLTLGAIPAYVRPTQLDFFRPNGPSPATLAATIARLAALCGPDRVGTPTRIDAHRPGAMVLTPFSGHASAPSAPESAARGVAAIHATAPVAEVVRVALRAFRPPVPLEVFESAGHLDYVRGAGLGGRVVHLAGPWRLRGEWWSADPYAREYYDIELSDGGVYRIYRDGRTGHWKADGLYD
jgi:protein ImuB